MIPEVGTNPEINILTIGANILIFLSEKNQCCTIESLFEYFQINSNLSLYHIILSLDWLYTIKAININENWIFICNS